ncbi:MAG: exodeoxyribonuclease VII large subunit, partial [Phocaeicola sp.]|nr:exodeoxyribonuclease VII large subunit [Phocaeicola sp.]
MEKQVLSLYELNGLVRRSIQACLPDEYWVQAELSDVRSNYSGHCYLELVQKDPKSNSLVAKARGMIWSNVFFRLKSYFEEETGQAFVSGIKVLVKVTVGFHELYGFSLTIIDIDPTYTLGDMARRRKEILNRLDAEGILTLNKELDFPELPQRIAVISSATAAGYGDFCNQLENNIYGFQFFTRLFPAVMQGDKVESSIIAALDAINAEIDNWDAVVIIRGGGATSDLSGFDTYDLAANCAQFPLPIITGIGHERDDTVLDMISHTRVKTPTAAAEFLIARFAEVAGRLEK